LAAHATHRPRRAEHLKNQVHSRRSAQHRHRTWTPEEALPRSRPSPLAEDDPVQLLSFGCSCQAIADTTCSATTIRNRRDEWIRLGAFTQLQNIALESYDRIVGLVRIGLAPGVGLGETELHTVLGRPSALRR
jgi:hypothetical protein